MHVILPHMLQLIIGFVFVFVPSETIEDEDFGLKTNVIQHLSYTILKVHDMQNKFNWVNVANNW